MGLSASRRGLLAALLFVTFRLLGPQLGARLEVTAVGLLTP
jgi:hypothetical protein